jgi:hypothetical protein
MSCLPLHPDFLIGVPRCPQEFPGVETVRFDSARLAIVPRARRMGGPMKTNRAALALAVLTTLAAPLPALAGGLKIRTNFCSESRVHPSASP